MGGRKTQTGKIIHLNIIFMHKKMTDEEFGYLCKLATIITTWIAVTWFKNKLLEELQKEEYEEYHDEIDSIN